MRAGRLKYGGGASVPVTVERKVGYRVPWKQGKRVDRARLLDRQPQRPASQSSREIRERKKAAPQFARDAEGRSGPNGRSGLRGLGGRRPPLHLIYMVRVARRDITGCETLFENYSKTLSQVGCGSVALSSVTMHAFAGSLLVEPDA